MWDAPVCREFRKLEYPVRLIFLGDAAAAEEGLWEAAGTEEGIEAHGRRCWMGDRCKARTVACDAAKHKRRKVWRMRALAWRGLEPETSRVTGRGSRVSRERSFYTVWIKSFGCIGLRVLMGDLVRNLVRFQSRTGCTFPSWNIRCLGVLRCRGSGG
jgi:hypothetical protein